MTNSKNDKVVSVRLSAKEVERLEDISKQWDISVSSVVRSFVSSCLYSLPSEVPDLIKREQPKAAKKVQINKQSMPDEDCEPGDKVKEKNKAIPPEKFHNVPRNASCPCRAVHPDGRPKKYKHCCGK